MKERKKREAKKYNIFFIDLIVDFVLTAMLLIMIDVVVPPSNINEKKRSRKDVNTTFSTSFIRTIIQTDLETE
jgi:hypothetical protein